VPNLRRALLYGLFIWLIPFGVAFAIFPLREVNRPLFESIMPVAVAGAVAGFGAAYLSRLAADFVAVGVKLGALWMAMSILIDAPLMLFGGPMQMSVGQYLADIGATYLIMPAVTIGIGAALARRNRAE
jgi:hypothetical protein